WGNCTNMIFRRLRKFLKPRLEKYPRAFHVYQSISWSLTRSRAASRLKRVLPWMGNIVLPAWIGPRYKLARRYAEEGELDKAMTIADDILVRKPDFEEFRWIGSIYWLRGRYQDAHRLFERMEQWRYQAARQLQYDRLRLRFFPSIHFAQIGHLGMLDKYI